MVHAIVHKGVVRNTVVIDKNTDMSIFDGDAIDIGENDVSIGDTFDGRSFTNEREKRAQKWADEMAEAYRKSLAEQEAAVVSKNGAQK